MSVIETFRASSARRQVLVVVLGAVVLGAMLAAVYFTVLRKPYDVLFTNLRTMDAATIVAELDKRHVPYRLADGGAKILVPRGIVDSTRLSVMSEDLPIKGTVGFELFNKSDMGLTEFAQQINYQRALQGELARTIMTLDEVDTARVHLSFSEPTIFRDDRRPPKASVTIIARPGRALSPETVVGIQRLVAAAVPDLATADVVVLDAHGRVVSGAAPAPVAPAAATPERRAIEEYYATKAREAVRRGFPGRLVDIAVSAERPGSSSSEGLESAFSRWTPENRAFSLDVAISTSPAPSADEVRQMRTLAGDAVGVEAGIGDTITVAGLESAPEARPARPPEATEDRPAWGRRPEPSTVRGMASFGRWAPLTGIGVAILVLLGSAALARRRMSASGALSSTRRRRYVRRLEALLADGGADAAGRS